MAVKVNSVSFTRLLGKKWAAKDALMDFHDQLQSPAAKKRSLLCDVISNFSKVMKKEKKEKRKKRKEKKKKKFDDDDDDDSEMFLHGCYVNDIDDYVHKMEKEEAKRRPLQDYMEKVQKDLTAEMRGDLVDWLVEVAEEYKLQSDTLYLSITYVDRFLSVNPLNKHRLQLLGVSSLWIASKFEETTPPTLDDFCYATDDTCTKEDMLNMEPAILFTLQFELSIPTINTFLTRPYHHLKTRCDVREKLASMAVKVNSVSFTRLLGKKWAAKDALMDFHDQLQSPAAKKRSLLCDVISNFSKVMKKEKKEKRKKRKEKKKKKFDDDDDDDSEMFLHGCYVNDIDDYVHKMEKEEAKRRPLQDYMEKVQKDLTAEMRGDLVDWLVEVAEEYKLQSDTLYLSITYVDRFLSVNPLNKHRLQLLGVSSLWIASKFEETTPPTLDDFCYATDDTCTKEDMLNMEPAILFTLQFELSIPTINTFLTRPYHHLKTRCDVREKLASMAVKVNSVSFTRLLGKKWAAKDALMDFHDQLQSPAAKKRSLLCDVISNFSKVMKKEKKEKRKKRKEKKKKKFDDDDDDDSEMFLHGCYVNDIDDYVHKMEKEEAKRRPLQDYMEKVQKDLTAEMRGDLVDWLVEVAEEYKLQSDTLYLSITYVDRFLSVNPLNKHRLQLLGVSSLWIASKFEETTPPTLDDFCYATDDTCTKEDMLNMEPAILFTLQFELSIPTINTFLTRFSRISQEDRKYTSYFVFELFGCYLADLSLLDYACLKFLPSVIASSVVFLSRFMFHPDKHPWNANLEKFSGYKPRDLKECVLLIQDLHLGKRGGSLVAVRDKYNQREFKYVCLIKGPLEIPTLYFDEG